MRHAPRPLPIAAALAAALATALAAGGVHAQAAAPKAGDDAATRAALDAARAELQRSARKVAELSRQLGEHERVVHVERHPGRKPVLGVVLAPDARAGVRIAAVTPESAAAKAGLRSGDRLVAVDGHAILGSEAGLRVANARKLLGKLEEGKPIGLAYERGGKRATVRATPKADQRVFVWDPSSRELMRLNGAVDFVRGPDGSFAFTADGIEGDTAPAVRAIVEREVSRLRDCDKRPCKAPLLVEAFRWNGLNLATVDAQLGRYFGTDRGVLVLSTGRALQGLQPGDVLRKVDGKPVASPREAMAVLEARPAGSSVSVEYLRDRKTATARVTVPKAMPLRFPAPPPPPPAPAAPPAPPAPAAPPAPRPPQAFEAAPKAAVVALVARAPTPPAPSAPPAPPAPPAPLGAQID
ncbi:MAG TPA: PDZ domain-containing protein [Xanthomonadaceae bacterium]|nr:PDZ domain-containing protein [Xanthomonadaceae bacterium]